MDRICELRWLLEGLAAWFRRLHAGSGPLRDRERAAVGAYLRALEETGLYLSDAGRAEDDEIPRLWMGAADAVREMDPELATRCVTKARRWPRPETWSSDDLSEACGEIGATAREAERLLRS